MRHDNDGVGHLVVFTGNETFAAGSRIATLMALGLTAPIPWWAIKVSAFTQVKVSVTLFARRCSIVGRCEDLAGSLVRGVAAGQVVCSDESP
ncbi:hypothetical protein [Streptomyces sp. NPDC060035]|uniref:hypothetical protein n=1 Tax=Streptomyces sp. NPDC060035 TaxID=3347044 RepID=UPI0036CA4B0F